MELQDTVKQALNALYHHEDDSVRIQADRWPQDFQRTIDAWQVADNLLHDAGGNIETLIFCSQTLRGKVQRDFEELPSEAFRPLRDSLNVLRAFASWLRLRHGIPASTLASHVLVHTALAGLNSEIPLEASVNVISELIHYTGAGNSDAPNSSVAPQVMSLKVQLRDDSKDEEDVKTIAQLFADMGDSYVELIATGSEESMLLVHALLDLTSHPDFDIASMTFNFWHSLQVKLIGRDSYLSSGDEASTEAERNQRMQLFCSSYESLVMLVSGFSIPKIIKTFQRRISRTSNKLDRAVAGCGNGENIEWRPAEAVLFCIRAVSDYVSVVEAEVMPQVLSLLPKLPQQPQLLQTVCLTIGAYSRWLDSSAFGLPILPLILDILMVGMKKSEDSAAAAALAFRHICDDCRKKLRGFLDGLFLLCHGAVIEGNDFKVPAEDSLHLVEALRYVNHPEAVADAIQRLWPIFEAIFNNHAGQMRTMESLCRACNYAVRTCGRFMGVTIGVILEKIQGLYQNHQPCFLYLSSEVIKIFGPDPSCANYLKNLIEALFSHTTCLLTKIQDFTIRPDVADDCFLLASRCIRYCPHIFIPSSVDCAMIGITVQHREATNSILTILSDIFDLAKSNTGEQFLPIRGSMIVPRGANVTRILVASITGALPSSRLETITYALLSLTRAYGIKALEWANESMSLIPSTALTEVERSRVLQALSEVAFGADINSLSVPIELSDVCCCNTTVQEIVQGALRPLDLNMAAVS
ncbi:hypothetical protein RJ641_009247, partial [Dillenia turbinata]